eukprot:4481131-Pleurochrysis_carterae.AAC.1
MLVLPELGSGSQQSARGVKHIYACSAGRGTCAPGGCVLPALEAVASTRNHALEGTCPVKRCDTQPIL